MDKNELKKIHVSCKGREKVNKDKAKGFFEEVEFFFFFFSWVRAWLLTKFPKEKIFQERKHLDQNVRKVRCYIWKIDAWSMGNGENGGYTQLRIRTFPIS